MKPSKLLISTVATAAIVGAIGFTNAQTSDNNIADSTSTSKSVDQTPGAGGNMNGDSSNTGAYSSGGNADSGYKDNIADSTSTPKSVDQTPGVGGSGNADSGSKGMSGTASHDSDDSASEHLARADRN
jgi:hypothetical protein